MNPGRLDLWDVAPSLSLIYQRMLYSLHVPSQVRAQLLTALLLLAGAAPAAAETLIVGIDEAYPPYQYVDKAGRPTGFDVELFEAVAEAEGLVYEIRSSPWHRVREQLEAGEIHISVGMLRSEARDEDVDFSVPTVVVEQALFVREDSGVRGRADLKGDVVAVQRATLWEDRIRERGYDVTIKPLSRPGQVLQQVNGGQADAGILLLDQGLFLIRALGLGGIRWIGMPTDVIYDRFAVREGDAELLASLNDGLSKVRASGRYDSIYDRWLGVLHEPPVWQNPVVRALLAGAGVVLVLLVASLFWSRTLSRRVDERTRALAEAAAEQHRLEAQLLHAQKMDALGRLAGGVAHDFNNVLTIIRGTLGLVLAELGPEHCLAKVTRSASTAADTAFQLTEQLLTFSRREEVAARKQSLNALVTEQHEMLQRLLGSALRIELDLDADLPEILMDRGQASQILLNLVVNARDATERGGTIRISTRAVEVEGSTFVRLSVTDDGSGIDAGTLDRIFEPFFTTKGKEGSGLGLSTVYGIATRHGGRVHVESKSGEGSVFHVDLPPAP